MIKKLIAIIMAVAVLSISIVGCTQKEQEEPIYRTELIMGTVVKITLFDGGSEEILDKAFECVGQIEDLVSVNKEGTEISKLNQNAGIKSTKLSDTSYDIIDKALNYSKLSKGGYDLTIGPLVKLWSIGLPEAKVPTQEEINEIIKKIDYSKVEINSETKEVFLSEKGMMLDLGSIAKGYATDEVAKLLKEEGVKSAIIDLGGNIYALGLKEGDKNWNIGIQNPFDNRGSVVGAIEVSDKTVVTSGVYERYIEEDGVKYHHILNPSTGYPYETDIQGVSIIADKSIDGDALSTLVFTKGIDEGLKLIESLDGIDAIFITNKKEVYISEGLRDKFKITNEEFKLSN
ncbi:FAD:protein FMN transferase [Romboutsia sp.]|uniref:FAD:protein FMN transferase n=1 Tax=Romboutsia sp. TaxID=1965302 RepID=UPI003F2AA495